MSRNTDVKECLFVPNRYGTHVHKNEFCATQVPHCLVCGYPRREIMSGKCEYCFGEMWDIILGKLSRSEHQKYIDERGGDFTV